MNRIAKKPMCLMGIMKDSSGKNGQWLHVSKVFNTALQDGQFPTDKKILNDDGGIDEKLLKATIDKNKKKAN